MAIAKTSFLWTTLILLLVGLAALIGIVGTSFWLVQRSDVYFDEVIQARAARTASVSLRDALLNMETGQRGFLLTGNEAYLEPFNEAREGVHEDYEKLRQVLLPYPQANAAMEQMARTIKAKLDEMEQTIALKREGRTDEAIAIITTNRGKIAMDEARKVLDAIIAAADKRSAQGVENQRSNVIALRLVTLIGGAAIILVVCGAVLLTLRYTRELVAARAELEVLNRSLEERVQERTQELVRANEEVQRFAYIVTHDLRAPLVNIMGFTAELEETLKSIQAYVLADETPPTEVEIREARAAAGEELPEAIGFIRSSTRKMDALINAILKISREGKRPLKPEPIELGDLLQANAEAVHHQVTETGGEIRVDADGISLVSDRLALEQIVGNLLDNAVKYRSPQRPVEIDINARRELGGRIRIAIQDNGRGIAREDHERVFDLFRRSGEQDQKGEGIGLAYVRSVARNLGGEVTLESEFGKGTTFTITLPADIRTVVRSQ